MTERKQVPIEKSPIGAVVLSMLIPGLGFFYIGNYLKGIAYMALFATLIVFVSHGSGEAPFFGIAIGGFYIFQIIDSYNEAQKSRYKEEQSEPGQYKEISLTAAIITLVIGVAFQLRNLDIIYWSDIEKFWPLILVGIGIKLIFDYTVTNRGKIEKKPEEENRGDQWIETEKPGQTETGGKNE
jgi:hypothetical protein